MSKFKSIFLGRNKFLIMILFAVILTGVLVEISMLMYHSSGAAQLDLSRPGYVDVRDKAVKNDADFQTYAASGEMNQKTISEFKVLFVKQATKVKSVDAFGGDPLSPESLGINAIEIPEASQ